MPKFDNSVVRTFVLLKPDAIARNLTGEILMRFERKGLKMVASELRWIDEKFAAEHYAEHQGNVGYFKKMTQAIASGPSLAIIFEGPSAIAAARQLIGSQSPLHDSPIGSIRADFAIHEPYNLVHGSDSNSAAAREITLWFGKQYVTPNKPANKPVLAPKIAAIPTGYVKSDDSMPPMPPKLPKFAPKSSTPNFGTAQDWTHITEWIKEAQLFPEVNKAK